MFVVVGAIIAIELAWFIFVGPPNNPTNYAAQSEAKNLFLGLSAEAWTAIFTGALTFSTIGLWISTDQSAGIAARALDSLERPIIFPSIVKTNFDGYSSFVTFWSASDHGLMVKPEVKFAFRNYGKVPAKITDIRVGIRFQNDPPALDDLSSPPPVVDLIIEQGQFFERDASTEILGPSLEEMPLWAFGIVRYRGVLGTDIERETEFLWKYTRDAPIHFGPALKGPKNRNRTT